MTDSPSTAESPLADLDRDAFWARVDKSGECWIWTGGKIKGYGSLRYKGKHYYAHQVAWELETGAPPAEGMELLHECDNPPCIRPEPSHVHEGTHTENMQDMSRRGRGRNQNTGKTHCSQCGRPLAPGNLVKRPDSRRECLICHRRHWREWNERRKQKLRVT